MAGVDSGLVSSGLGNRTPENGVIVKKIGI